MSSPHPPEVAPRDEVPAPAGADPLRGRPPGRRRLGVARIGAPHGDEDAPTRPALWSAGVAGAAGPGTGSVTRQGVRLIARFVRLHPAPFVVSLVGGVAWAALVVAASYVLGRVTDDVITPAFRDGIEASTAWWAVAALVGVGVARGASVVVRRWFGSVTEARMQVSLRTAAVERLLTMPLSAYRSRPTGQLLATADADVNMATQMLMPLPFSLGVIALVVISLASLLLADPAFAAVAVLLFPAMAWLSRYYTDRVHEPSAQVQARLGRVSAVAHESFDGALVVKTLGREDAERERFEAAAADLRSERLVVARMTALFQPLIAMLPNLGVIALLLAGAWRIDQGAATAGELVQAVALFGWLAFPMRIVGFLFESIPRAVVSVARVDELLGVPVDPAAEGDGRAGAGAGAAADGAGADGGGGADAPAALPDGPLGVELRDVSFAYGGAPVLDGVTFDVAPGEVVALVGPTGAGKSTLANLLLRLDEPDSGEVRVGGVPVDRVDPAELRRAVSLAFQESYLFAASVADNVRLDRAVDDDVVTAVLERARARRFVDALPAGRATVVGERGVTLSGGQRQRVALARALAGSPRVLVLDDATSAVDPVIEAEILDGLRGGDTTLLIVAHRLSTILLADRVVHLADGRVCAVGTHAELLAGAEYAALVTAYEAEESAEHDAHFDDPEGDVVGTGGGR